MEKIALMINDRWLMVRRWIRENRLEFVLLILILFSGAFFRLYKISEYMTFLGDEGRDAIVVRRLLVDFDPILIGPRTSIGDMYLGPLYYYLMAPAMLLSGLSPVGPSVQMALLGVATVFLIWFVAREWFSPRKGKLAIGALIAAGLYSLAPVVIEHARHSWNPNIMPFFALSIIYGLWKIWSPFDKATEGQAESSKRFNWLIVVGVSFAFVLQSHYLGLLLAPTIGLFWLLSFIKAKSSKLKAQSFLQHSAFGLVIFVFLMSPLVIFDARHGWRNFASMKKFFGERQSTVSARPWTALPKFPETVTLVATRLIAGKNETAGEFSALILSIGSGFVFFKLIYATVKKRKLSYNLKAYLVLLTWLGFAFIGLGLYKQHIYDHYYGFFFPAPFLLLGGFAENMTQSAKSVGKMAILVGFALLLYINLAENPLKYPPNRQMQRTIAVSEKISEEARGEKFNIAVIAERNYEDAYQYFLEKEREPVVDIDALRADETITEQLFVVCELPKEKCDPTHDPKAEVANFGWSKIDNEWVVAGVTLFRLVHTQ